MAKRTSVRRSSVSRRTSSSSVSPHEHAGRHPPVVRHHLHGAVALPHHRGGVQQGLHEVLVRRPVAQLRQVRPQRGPAGVRGVAVHAGPRRRCETPPPRGPRRPAAGPPGPPAPAPPVRAAPPATAGRLPLPRGPARPDQQRRGRQQRRPRPPGRGVGDEKAGAGRTHGERRGTDAGGGPGRSPRATVTIPISPLRGDAHTARPRSAALRPPPPGQPHSPHRCTIRPSAAAAAALACSAFIGIGVGVRA